MKKIVLSMIILMVIMTGCNSSGLEAHTEQTNSVEKIINETITSTSSPTTVEAGGITDDNTVGPETVTSAVKVDIDLTKMNTEMIYATVYQFMTNSQDYIGTGIKIKGTFLASYYAATDKYYYNCIIQDATACCAQGLEFELADKSYETVDDYPADGTEIIITGYFETYQEGDENVYCKLSNAEMQIVK